MITPSQFELSELAFGAAICSSILDLDDFTALSTRRTHTMSTSSIAPTLQTWFGGTGSFTKAKDWSPPGSPVGTDTLIINAGQVRADNLTISNPSIHLGSSAATPTLVLNNVTLGATDQIRVQSTTFDPTAPRLKADIIASGTVTQNGAFDVGTTAVNVNQLFPADLSLSIKANSSFTLSSSGIWFSNDGSNVSVQASGKSATFIDNGEIDAYGGNVTFGLPVSGNGYFKIASNNAGSLNGTVEFASAVSSGTVVNLTAGILKLDGPLTFLGTIEDFNAASTIDLSNIQATFANYIGGSLLVFDRMHEVAALKLPGFSSAGQFNIEESNGSTFITLAAANSSTPSAASGLLPHSF
jgi:hypothetical protein